MSEPIRLDPNAGAVEVGGQLLWPEAGPLRIGIWRRVRHPPPDLSFVAPVKEYEDRQDGLFSAGDPVRLVGKVLTWQWACWGHEPDPRGWKVRIDVRQDGLSVPGYPIEYEGSLPRGRPLAELRIIEPIIERRRGAAPAA